MLNKKLSSGQRNTKEPKRSPTSRVFRKTICIMNTMCGLRIREFSIGLNVLLPVLLLGSSYLISPSRRKTVASERVSISFLSQQACDQELTIDQSSSTETASEGSWDRRAEFSCSLCADQDCCRLEDRNSTRHEVFLVILAKSAPGNLERRQNWRSIWEHRQK